MGFRRLCVRKECHTIERFSLVDSVLKSFFLLKSISNKVFAKTVFTLPVCSYCTLRIAHSKTLSDSTGKTSGCNVKAAPLN